MLNAMSVTEEPAATLPLRWLEAHGDALYAFAIRRVRRAEAAEDLVQETLLAALQAWEQFTHRSHIRTWLIGILRHKVADHLRARYRHEKIDARWPDDDAMFNRHGGWRTAVTSWSVDPMELAQRAEFRQVMDACMEKLPVRMAHLFLSRVDGGVATADLCAELEISSENAWTLLHRARSRLRHCLTVNWFGKAADKNNATV